MNQKVSTTVVVLSLLFGVSGFLFGLSRGLEATPSTPLAAAGSSATAAPTEQPSLYHQLVQQVAPIEGHTVPVRWGDTGRKLVEAGAIDLARFEAHYNGFTEEQAAIINGDSLAEITFRADNIQFWTNVLWALGLTQKTKVLGEGPMMQNRAQTPLGNYASTGGWTLGTKPATELYNSTEFFELTPEQDELVYRVAENVFRPCCGNHTAYPDCNHGMAVLGLIALLASQGGSEEALYDAALAFNAYAFSDTYVTTAAYFNAQSIAWSDVEPKEILSADFSGAQGSRRIAAAVGPIPGTPGQGGSCGA